MKYSAEIFTYDQNIEKSMVELNSEDFGATKLFLLSHVDPLYVIEITDRASQDPSVAATPNTILFGTNVHVALRPLLRRLIVGALGDDFLRDLLQVMSQSRLRVDFAGLDVLKGLDPTIEVLDAPPPYHEQFTGAVRAADAACDLLLQPLMAFGNFFNSLAGEWPGIAANPELSAQVYYRTNQSNFFRARLENRIRLELGLTNRLMESFVLNIP